MSEDITYAILKKPFDTDFNNPTETGKNPVFMKIAKDRNKVVAGSTSVTF